MHDENCIFCKIANGEIPTEFLFEDDDVVAFRDLNPQSPVHILVIPRRHLPTLADASDEDAQLLGKLLLTGKKLAEREGVSDSGFRSVINCNPEAGQEVFHLHLHIMGGRQMRKMG